MKKTKKALLAALACSAVLAGAFGLAACNKGDDSSSTGGGETQHSHSYGTWTSNNDGTHNGTCANTDGKCDALNVTNLECDTDGTDGACSKCGYKEDEGDDSTVKLNKEVTVTTADGVNPVKFQIELEAGSYQILVDGEAIEVDNASDVVLGAWYEDEELNIVYTDVEKAMDLSETSYYYNTDHIYYIEVYANVTFKVVAFEHVHTEDTTTWESDSTGHWHPLTCSHMGQKGTVEEHHFGELSAADEDGIKTKTCSDCGYTESDISGLEATTVTGGVVTAGDWIATPVTADNIYKTAVNAQMGEVGGYNPGEYYFGITCGNEAKTYTIKVLTENTKISNVNTETLIEEAGGEYQVVVRANATFEFSVTTLDETCGGDYSYEVAFKITESAAPFEGDVTFPVIVHEGENVKKISANAFIFYVIENSYGGGPSGDLKITFGEGVSVRYLGSSTSNSGTNMTSGDIIMDSDHEYNDVYLCVTADSNGDISFTVESTIAEGKKGNPIAATFGADSANQVALDSENDVYEQWFKVTAETVGLFVVKSASSGANFEVYNSVDDDMPALTGSRIILDLEADATVYIRATSMEGTAYAFTITEATEADRGYSPNYAIEIKGSGEYNIPAALLGSYDAAFFTYTATADGTVTIAHTGAEYACFIWVNVDEYEEGGGTPNSSSPVTINAEKGHTYIIACYPEGLTDGTLTVTGVPQANVEIPFTSDTAPSGLAAVGTLYAEQLTWEGSGRWNAGNAGEPATNAINVGVGTKIVLKVAGEVTVSWYGNYGAASDILVYYDANGCATIEVVNAHGQYMTGLTVNPNVIHPASKVINVTLNYDNGSENGTWKAVVGSVMNKPADPTKTGAKFLGWKLNGEDYDFTEAVPDDETLTLVAQWGSEDADFDITTDTIDLSTFTTGKLEGSSATYRGVIVDATNGKFDPNDGYVQMTTGCVLKFAAPANVTSTDGITVTMTFHGGTTVTGDLLLTKFELGYENGYITIKAIHSNPYPEQYPITISFDFGS